MTTIRYTLRPMGRLTVGLGGAVVNSKSTARIIPGSTVRGALGWSWIRQDRLGTVETRAKAFAEQFLPRVRVGQGIATFRGSADPERSPQMFSRLEHLFLEACTSPREACALVGATESGAGRWWNVALGGPAEQACSCGSKKSKGKGWQSPSGLVQASTRSQLNADGTAADGLLFTREMLSDRFAFVGTIRCGENVAPATLEWLLRPRKLRVGGQRSTSGDVEWTAEEVTSTSLDHFDTDGAAVVVATSPIVLTNRYGGPTLDLAGYIHQRFPHARIEATRTRATRITGWNGQARTSRPDDLAIDAGSAASVSGLTATDVVQLAEGIGLRRGEGYGEVRVDGRPSPTTSDLVWHEHRALNELNETPPWRPVPLLAAEIAHLSLAEQIATVSHLIDASRQLGLHEAGAEARVGTMLQQPWAIVLGGKARLIAHQMLTNSDEHGRRGSRRSAIEALKLLLGSLEGAR